MSKEIYGRIYLITNIINNKLYIGQTTRTIKIRFQGHIKDAKQNSTMAICKAINKYGKENFIIEQIAVAYTQEQLNFSEGFYISLFKSLTTQNGYNITNITNGRIQISEKTKQKLKVIANSPERLKQASEKGKKTRGKSRYGSKFKYCGISKNGNKWRSQFIIDNKRINLGNYLTEVEAAQAYDIAAIQNYGHNATLNFPELREQYIQNKILPQKSVKNILILDMLVLIKIEINGLYKNKE